LPRFYAPKAQVVDGMIRLEGREVKHIRTVLRLGVGDEILLFDGQSMEYEGSIAETGTSYILVRVDRVRACRTESPLYVTLAQSLLKGEKMDYVVQKATEVGVKRISPFISSRSIPRLEKSKDLTRRRRWEKIAMEASKQCGRGAVPEIETVRNYDQVIENPSEGSVRLLLWEKEGEHLKKVLGSRQENSDVFFIVGPEGGLSLDEVEKARRVGFIPVNLGRRILRAETAGICLLSILQYEWGDMG
jgi:16S rRNA (uracil1498-N3)-methyltransferase